jgi:hypothetical protein
LGLTSFFILLTLSIGLVFVNLPLTVKAQHNALSHDGIGDSEQEIKEGQLSEHNGQVVSGETSILSGNNLACQDQENSETVLGLCPDRKILPNTGVSTLTIKTVLRANCDPDPRPFNNCPHPDGRVIIQLDGKPYFQYDPRTNMREGTTERTFPIPVGTPYGIQAQGVNGGDFFSYELGNIQGDCSGRDRCNAVMGPNGANVIVNFHYRAE